MKYSHIILFTLTLCFVGSTTAHRKTGFKSLWDLISESTRRSQDIKATGIDLLGKNGLVSKTIIKPTPPAFHKMPPPQNPPTEPNFAELGHIQRELEKMALGAKRGCNTKTSQVQTPQFSCTKEYAAIPGHALCLQDSPNVVESGISELDKVLILQHHNKLRSQVQPPATDLVKLKWDDRLAAVAQKWANQCVFDHDRHLNIPSIGMSVGQNLAAGHGSWEKAVQAWYDEIFVWKYGINPSSYLRLGQTIGHFTQIVQSGTYLLGCGYANCKNVKRLYVCDYAAGQHNLKTPYTSGPRCSKCPHSCIDGLCDCKSIVCYNGGKLDIDNCQCDCNRLYKGRMCEQLNCPVKDPYYCGGHWPQSYCKKYRNVPVQCPYMCGRCKVMTVQK